MVESRARSPQRTRERSARVGLSWAVGVPICSSRSTYLGERSSVVSALGGEARGVRACW